MQQPADSILSNAMLCKLGALYKNVEITLYINLKVNQKKEKFYGYTLSVGFQFLVNIQTMK